jgi:hypothetical protein
MNRFAVRQRGGALDYAVNDGLLHVGVFDVMGHGLAAAGVRRSPYVQAQYLRRIRLPRIEGVEQSVAD